MKFSKTKTTPSVSTHLPPLLQPPPWSGLDRGQLWQLDAFTASNLGHIITCHQVKPPCSTHTFLFHPAWYARWGWANCRVWESTPAGLILLDIGRKLLSNFLFSSPPSSLGSIPLFHLTWLDWTFAGGQLCLLVGLPPLLLLHPTCPAPHHQPAHPLPGAAQEQVFRKRCNSNKKVIQVRISEDLEETASTCPAMSSRGKNKVKWLMIDLWFEGK